MLAPTCAPTPSRNWTRYVTSYCCFGFRFEVFHGGWGGVVRDRIPSLPLGWEICLTWSNSWVEKSDESSDLNKKKKLCDKPREVRDCFYAEFGHDSHYLSELWTSLGWSLGVCLMYSTKLVADTLSIVWFLISSSFTRLLTCVPC